MSHTIITRIAFGAAALVGVAALGACGTTGGSAAPVANNQPDGNAVYADTAHTNGSTGGNQTDGTGHVDPPADQTPRCDTKDLKLEVAPPVQVPVVQSSYDLKLSFRNISGRTCDLHGVPGVDLIGPSDATHTDTFNLPRLDDGPASNVVRPGAAATAVLHFYAPAAANPDSWQPATINTTPPGSYSQLTAAWPSGFRVLREQGSAHPATSISGLDINTY